MTRTVLLNYPIKAEIRTVDSQSDLIRFVLINELFSYERDRTRLENEALIYMAMRY